MTLALMMHVSPRDLAYGAMGLLAVGLAFYELYVELCGPADWPGER